MAREVVCSDCESKDLIKYGKDGRGQQRYWCRNCNRYFSYSPTKSSQPWQKKPSNKGHKSTRGRPEMYEEVKKSLTVAVTPTAVTGLDEQAKEFGISRSELIERIGRRLLLVSNFSPESKATEDEK